MSRFIVLLALLAACSGCGPSLEQCEETCRAFNATATANMHGGQCSCNIDWHWNYQSADAGSQSADAGR